MRFMVTVVVAAIALAGCGATSGTKVTDEQLQKLEVGKTTYTEAVALLGRPNYDTVMSGGKRVVTYAYSEFKARPETFIPFAGAFVGGSDGHSQAITLAFDKDGRLSDTTSSSSVTNSSLMGGSHTTATTAAPTP